METLEFTVDEIRYPVKITYKKEDGTSRTESFYYTEAGSHAGVQYKDAQGDAIQLDTSPETLKSNNNQPRVTGIEGVGKLEPLLVSLCLFREDDTPVTLQEVQRFPYRIVKRLHDEIKKISHLDEAGAEKAKN